MNLVAEYLKSIKKNIVFSALLGLCASACQTVLIIFISKLETGSANYRFDSITKYYYLIFIFFISNLIFNILITKISQYSSYKIQRILCKKIITLPLAVIEKLGQHRLQTALTQDTFNIVSFISIVPYILIDGLLIFSCLAYLFSLSKKIFLITFCLLLLVSVLFLFLDKYFISTKLIRAREILDELYKNFHGLLVGSKELKLDRSYRDSFIKNQLLRSAYDYYRNNFISMAAFSSWQTLWQVLLFLLVGLIIFHGNMGMAVLQQSITVILFIASPLLGLISFLPTLRRSMPSFSKIKELDKHMNETTIFESKDALGAEVIQIKQLQLNKIEYNYEDSSNAFKLGPININFSPSEVTFIVGKNGSGKSTLVKLLAGLYEPSEGQIILNDIIISQENLAWYRDHIAVLFYNYYLFENFVIEKVNSTDELIELSQQLQIGTFINFDKNTYFKSEASDGQQRRLAFLNMMIQNKPICILDEPMSDQDVYFKNFFYHQLIPNLKKDRCVIIISHDPNYYHLADKIIYLEQGKLSSQTNNIDIVLKENAENYEL